MATCQNYDLQTIGVNVCLDNMGGVERVWVADRANFTKPSTKPTAGTLDLSTVISGDDDATRAAHFIELAFDKNLTTYTETASFAEGVGLSYTTECAMEFYQMTTNKRNAIDHLAHNKQMIAIVLDNNGLCHFMGYDWGVSVSNVVGTTSTNLTDVNNYQVTLQDTTKNLNYTLGEKDKVLAILVAAEKPSDPEE